MARNCSADAESQGFKTGIVDLGISPSDSHTAFSKNPETAVHAFIDFLYLLDAKSILRTGSSFSGAVAAIKGHDCLSVVKCYPNSNKCTFICLPSDCF